VTNEAPGLLALPTNSDYSVSGNDLMMKVDNTAGYAVDASVNCDSVGGSLRTSKDGKVYRKLAEKYMHGPDAAIGASHATEHAVTDLAGCLKLCEDTTGCVAVNIDIAGSTQCRLRKLASCDDSTTINIGDNNSYDLYELAEVLSRTCTVAGKNNIFPFSYAFATKTLFKIKLE